jgi:hypothetical protein
MVYGVCATKTTYSVSSEANHTIMTCRHFHLYMLLLNILQLTIAIVYIYIYIYMAVHYNFWSMVFTCCDEDNSAHYSPYTFSETMTSHHGLQFTDGPWISLESPY